MADQALKEMTELEKILLDLNNLGERLAKNQSETQLALHRAVFYQEPMPVNESKPKESPPGDDMVWKLNNVIKNFEQLVNESETIRNHVNRLA